jgi:hypothetical protein
MHSYCYLYADCRLQVFQYVSDLQARGADGPLGLSCTDNRTDQDTKKKNQQKGEEEVGG